MNTGVSWDECSWSYSVLFDFVMVELFNFVVVALFDFVVVILICVIYFKKCYLLNVFVFYS